MASRLTRPTWRDPRFAAGVALVALSALGGSTLLARATHTTPVWTATTVILPGDALTADNLQALDLPLSQAADKYAPATGPLEPGLVASRTVHPGELLPVSAVTTEAEVGLRSVGIPITQTLSPKVARGTRVDLWLLPAEDRAAETQTPPRAVAVNLEVETADDGSSPFAGRSTVHVLVPSSALPDVLAALGSRGTPVLVPHAADLQP